eukprot:s158_g31.t1
MKRRARDCREWNDQELRRRNVLTGVPAKEAPPSIGPSTPGPKRFDRLRRLNVPIAVGHLVSIDRVCWVPPAPQSI